TDTVHFAVGDDGRQSVGFVRTRMAAQFRRGRHDDALEGHVEPGEGTALFENGQELLLAEFGHRSADDAPVNDVERGSMAEGKQETLSRSADIEIAAGDCFMLPL